MWYYCHLMVVLGYIWNGDYLSKGVYFFATFEVVRTKDWTHLWTRIDFAHFFRTNFVVFKCSQPSDLASFEKPQKFCVCVFSWHGFAWHDKNYPIFCLFEFWIWTLGQFGIWMNDWLMCISSGAPTATWAIRADFPLSLPWFKLDF